MPELLVALDRGIGVPPAMLAAAWNADRDSCAVGSARVGFDGRGNFLPGGLELVIIPLAVNLASSAVYDLIRKLVRDLRHGEDNSRAIELIEITTSSGDRVVVVRAEEKSP